MEFAESDFLPGARHLVVDADPDLGGGPSWMVTGRLEADASKRQVLPEFNHDPRSIVECSEPFVPRLCTWTDKVLRDFDTSQHAMFSRDFGGSFQVVTLHAAKCGRGLGSLLGGLLLAQAGKRALSTTIVKIDVDGHAVDVHLGSIGLDERSRGLTLVYRLLHNYRLRNNWLDVCRLIQRHGIACRVVNWLRQL